MKLKQMVFVSLSVCTFLHGGLLGDLLGGNSGDGEKGIFDDFSISGMGTLQLTCKKPSVQFNFDNFDFCSIENKINSALNLKLEDIQIGSKGCGISIPVSQYGCQKKIRTDLCKSKDKILSKILNGTGGWSQASSMNMILFGGKELFGKKGCGNQSAKKNALSSSLKRVYGSNGKAISMMDTGKQAINTRISSQYLKCLEAASSSGISLNECKYGSSAALDISINSNTSSDIANSVKYGGVQPSGDLVSRMKMYYPLFLKYAKQWNIPSARLLMAIGMHESNGLHPNIVGGRNWDGTHDVGMMQLNPKYWRKPMERKYPQYGRWEGIAKVPHVNIDFGAQALHACFSSKSIRGYWTAVRCYNRGFKKAYTPNGYVAKVKAQLAKIDPALFPDDGNVEVMAQKADIQSTSQVASYSTMSEMATMPTKTITHIGNDAVQRLPIEKRVPYMATINRYMAQTSYIKASQKKIADIEKALNELEQVESGIYDKSGN